MFNLKPEIKTQKEASPTYDESLWEEAAIEEVESGKFEAIQNYTNGGITLGSICSAFILYH